MKKTSKIIVCALFIPAGAASAVSAAEPVGVRNMEVASVMTGKLSETAAGLSAAQEAGDSARAEALLNSLFAGGGARESAPPVYAAQPAAVPVSRAVHYNVTVEEQGAAAPAVAVSTGTDAPHVYPGNPADGTLWFDASPDPQAKEKEDAAAAKKAKEDAQKVKENKIGFYIAAVALLLLLLLL